MAELLLIRHAQASFGAADYDKLSDLGHTQSRALGKALKDWGVAPDAVFIGAQRRHRETWEGINEALQFGAAPGVLPGFNEFDFGGLLDARYAGKEQPATLHSDRRLHFKTLRETVLEWQKDEIENPPERFADFTARVRAARAEAMRGNAKTTIVVSSGGTIGYTVSEIMQAPADAMIRLQLQIKNCSVTRLIITPKAEHLSTFNETPHIDASTVDPLLTYS